MHRLHRFGACSNPCSKKNCCSSAVNVKSRLQTLHRNKRSTKGRRFVVVTQSLSGTSGLLFSVNHWRFVRFMKCNSGLEGRPPNPSRSPSGSNYSTWRRFASSLHRSPLSSLQPRSAIRLTYDIRNSVPIFQLGFSLGLLQFLIMGTQRDRGGCRAGLKRAWEELRARRFLLPESAA